MINLVLLTLVVAALVNMLLITVLVHKRIRSLFHFIFILHLVSTLGWILSILFFLRTEQLFASQLAFACALLMTVSKYYFVKIFPENRPGGTVWFYIPLIWAVPLLVLCFVPNAYYTEVYAVNMSYITSVAGPFAFVYMVSVLFFLVSPIVGLVKKMRSDIYSVQVRRQIKVLLHGMTIFFITAFITNLVLPVIFNFYYLNGIGPVFSLILAVFIAHNIYRYKFLEIQTFIQRSLVYTFLLVIVVVAYVGVMHLVSFVAQPTLEITALTAGIVTTVVGVFTIPTIDYQLRRVTHSWFFKGIFDYGTVLHELSSLLHQSLRLEEIISMTTVRLAELFCASHVHISLKGDNVTTAVGEGIHFSLRTSNGCVGELQLGEKKSGDCYTKHDQQMLSTFVNQLAIAIERAQLHEEMRAYNRVLEQKVRVRTHELAEAYARQRDMIADISHGLQTPMTIIQNELQTMSPEVRKMSHIASFSQSVATLSQFIKHLLHLSHVQASIRDTAHEQCNMSALLIDIVEYVSVSFAADGVACEAHIEPDVYVQGDRKQLEEMVNILIHNAYKYRSHARVQKITITLLSTNDTITLTIHDIGLGIPQEYHDQIFRRFYRIQHKTHRHTEGSGLGLSIASAIVKAHHGTISVRSKVDVYTEFIICLPSK